MSEHYTDPLINENGERIATEGGPKKEPVRKGVAGSAAGAVTLLAAWILSEIGVEMPLEVQAAAAVLVGAVIAYAKSEF